VHGAGRVAATLDRPAATSQDRLAGRIGASVPVWRFAQVWA